MEVIYLALWCAVGAVIGVVIVNVYARGPPMAKTKFTGPSYFIRRTIAGFDVVLVPLDNERRICRLIESEPALSTHPDEAAAEREVRRLMEPASEPKPWE